ncbi:MAG: hypothetical protein RL424_358, partial [Pseudomonadota bacterium]
FFCFALGMMLSVNCSPFLRDHASCKPEPKAKEMRDDGMKLDGAMGLATMKIDGDPSDGDVGNGERESNNFKPAPAGQSILYEFKD